MDAEAQSDGHPQAGFLLEVVQGLLDAEAKRDDAVNSRGIAVVALSGVMLALTASISASVLEAGVDRGWRILAAVLLSVAIASLAAAATTAILGVLRPRRFAMLAISEINKFNSSEYLERSDQMNKEILLTGMVDILAHERSRSATKAAWLRRSYTLILGASAALALTGVLGASRAAEIIPSRDGDRRPPAPRSAATRDIAPARDSAQTPRASSAHRVRREGAA